MGGFFLLRKTADGSHQPDLAEARSTFGRLGFDRAQHVAEPDYDLLIFPKHRQQAPVFKQYPNGDLAFACGTFVFQGRIGIEAIDRFYDAFAGKIDICEQAYGHFIVIIKKHGRTHVFNDALGACHVFFDETMRVFSSSFLAAASALPRLTVSSQGVYEYVFDGVVSGSATLMNEIRLLPRKAQAVVAGPSIEIERTGAYVRNTLGSDFEALVSQSLLRLNDYFDRLANLFGDRISCALSGGYDSRLILALLRRRGITPKLYVYGKSTDPDVQIARMIAAGEGLHIDHIDKDEVAPVPPERFPEIVERNYYSSDGYYWEGIFDNGAEYAERYRRIEGGVLNLNGGGGEAFRNFFYLRDGTYSRRQLLWSFYGQFDPQSCSEMFDENRHYAGLEAKLDELIGEPRPMLERSLVEWLYPNFRCRSFMGRTVSINNWTGHSLLPFFDFQMSEQALRIPLGMKHHGRFEAELIRRTHPRIAAYPSVYGHNFIDNPPLRRLLRDGATYLRPAALRRFTFRIKHRLKRADDLWDGYFAPGYLTAALPGGLEQVKRFFNLEAVRDVHQLQRIVSLEYMLAKFDGKLRFDGEAARR